MKYSINCTESFSSVHLCLLLIANILIIKLRYGLNSACSYILTVIIWCYWPWECCTDCHFLQNLSIQPFIIKLEYVTHEQLGKHCEFVSCWVECLLQCIYSSTNPEYYPFCPLFYLYWTLSSYRTKMHIPEYDTQPYPLQKCISSIRNDE